MSQMRLVSVPAMTMVVWPAVFETNLLVPVPLPPVTVSVIHSQILGLPSKLAPRLNVVTVPSSSVTLIRALVPEPDRASFQPEAVASSLAGV
ncbi:hypothetical protein D3C74_384360 [compost metagenome]